MFLGSLTALIMGAALPSFSLLWGDMINSFNTTTEEITEKFENCIVEFYIHRNRSLCGRMGNVRMLDDYWREASHCLQEILSKMFA